MQCKICSSGFKDSPDSILLCEHRDGIVHLGCCVHNCSLDKKPCQHAVSIYDKLS